MQRISLTNRFTKQTPQPISIMTDIERIVKIIENNSPELAAEEILRLDGFVNWVPINKRLPIVEENVLVFDGYNTYITNRLDVDGIVWDESNQIFDEITHWMKLPNHPTYATN